MSDEVRRVYESQIKEAERRVLACEKLCSVAFAAQKTANTLLALALDQWKQAAANVSKLRSLLILQETHPWPVSRSDAKPSAKPSVNRNRDRSRHHLSNRR